MTSQAKVFEIKTAFRSCDEDPDSDTPPDLRHIPARLRQRYSDFFDVSKAIQQPAHRSIDHAIELKPGTEPPYMRMYNMSPAELKVLGTYLTEALERGWIHKFKSLAGALILFVSKKDRELHLCVNYHELNIIIIKN